MARFKCDTCSKSFNQARGLALHVTRKHTEAGRNWGKSSTPSKQTNKRHTNSGSNRDKMKKVLANHPEGLEAKNIVQAMKKLGFRPARKNSGYVSQMASSDPEIVRISRGVYRLQHNPQQKTSASVAVADTQSEVKNIPKETLYIQIKHLEEQLHALNRAYTSLVQLHTSFVREFLA